MTTTRKSFGFRVYDAALAQFVRDRAKETSVDTSDVVEQALRLLQDAVTKHEMDYLREHLPIQKNIDQDRSAFMQFPDDAPAAVGSTRGSFVVPQPVKMDFVEEVTLDRPRRSSFRSRVGAAASASRRSNVRVEEMADSRASADARRPVVAVVDPTADDRAGSSPAPDTITRPKGPDSGPDEALGF